MVTDRRSENSKCTDPHFTSLMLLSTLEILLWLTQFSSPKGNLCVIAPLTLLSKFLRILPTISRPTDELEMIVVNVVIPEYTKQRCIV